MKHTKKTALTAAVLSAAVSLSASKQFMDLRSMSLLPRMFKRYTDLLKQQIQQRLRPRLHRQKLQR